MARRFIFEELDNATQGYLRKAADSRGADMAGVFVPQSSALPWVGLIGGVALIVVTFWWTLPPLDDPLKTAMFQTAGLLLGGWMIVAALRTWASAGSKYNVGYFVFADGVRLWEGLGGIVQVTGLKALKNVEGDDKYNQGAYTGTKFTLYFDGGRHTFTVTNGDKATELYDYLQSLASEQMPTPGAFERVSATDYGVYEDGRALTATRAVAVAKSSPTPERVRNAGSNIVAFVVIVLAAAFGVVCLNALNVVWRDDAIFDMVKLEKPPMLRAYLIDPRNTRHREEVRALLSRHYDPKIIALQDRAQDKDLGGKLAALLEKIKVAPQPLVSIRVTDESKGDADPTRGARTEKRLVDALSATIGDDMIAFVKVPEDVPPIIDVRFAIEEVENDPTKSQVRWTVRIRDSVDEAEGAVKSWTDQRPFEESVAETLRKLGS
jgi:hypothetical protein